MAEQNSVASTNPLETERYVGERLGEFVASTSWSDLPLAIQHEAKRSILNFVAAALGAAGEPAVHRAIDVLRPFSAGTGATLIGHQPGLDAVGASFVNAVAGNWLDYDDTHLDTVIHPTAPVFPPALGLAEVNERTGAQLLAAFALGAEIECRLGNAISPGHYARGWHITATCGVFGSSVAVAKLLGLAPRKIWHALGIAASESAGVVENLPRGAKNVGIGNAARNGIWAALFAQQGYEAAPAAIEGKLGWARASGDEPKISAITGGLGATWELAKNTYKPYPCGIVMHAIVDACLALRTRHALSVDQNSSVNVYGDDLLMARGDRKITDAGDARVSIHHAAAAPLLWGAAGIGEFVGDTVFSAQAVELRARVHAHLDPALPPAAARVVVVTVDGSRFETTVTHARGSMQFPFSDAEIEGKLQVLVDYGGTRSNPDRIANAVWRLDEATTVHELCAALKGG